MNRLLACCLVLGATSVGRAQPNLLVNGDLEASPAFTYYDGFTPDVADDVPGWLMSLGSADGSYIQVSYDDGNSTTDLDSGCGPDLGIFETAAASRPAVSPGSSYTASVTTDNYFAPTSAAYFIDWYDGGGSLLSSVGGNVGDPNGPLTFEPYTQLFSVSGAAPANAATAGVRFTLGNAGYGGLTADNFSLSGVPEPGSMALALSAMGLLRAFRRRS